MDELKTISHDMIIDYPDPCPICKGKISVMATAWDEQDDGSIIAREIETQCETEPEIPDDDDIEAADGWDEWFSGHYSSPQQDWQGFDETALLYVRKNYRFDLGAK